MDVVPVQERKRFEAHKPSPYDDLSIARENLAKHTEWVLHGDNKPADPEENTYPLPHNAYGQRPLANTQQHEKSEDTSVDSSGNQSTDDTAMDSPGQSQNECTNQSQHLTQADAKNANTCNNVSITNSEIDAFFNK